MNAPDKSQKVEKGYDFACIVHTGHSSLLKYRTLSGPSH